MKKIFISLMVVYLSFALAMAQEKTTAKPYKDWELGINIGVANFTGEYNMYKDARFNHFNHWNSKIDLGFGATVKKNLSHVFGIEAMWNYSNLRGSWKHDARPIADFKTEVNEFDVNVVVNMNNLLSKTKFDRKVYWYAKIGVGAAHITKKVGETPLAGQHWKTPAIPLGTGVSYRISEKFRINVGTQWSWINTDRLDGRKTDMVSGNVKPGNTEADIFGTKLYTHIAIAYTFGKKKRPVPVETEIPRAIPVVKETKEEPPVVEPAPVVKPTVIGKTYKLFYGVGFGFNKSSLNKQAYADLDLLVEDMNENPSVSITIKSHTDCRGSAAYNMILSARRGKSVVDYLVSKGISPSRMHSEALGESQPINKCVDGVRCSNAEHAANRRTDITITE
jgi:outer membrane protein OmpA-like peptidoglycan-associated protein